MESKHKLIAVTVIGTIAAVGVILAMRAGKLGTKAQGLVNKAESVVTPKSAMPVTPTPSASAQMVIPNTSAKLASGIDVTASSPNFLKTDNNVNNTVLSYTDFSNILPAEFGISVS